MGDSQGPPEVTLKSLPVVLRPEAEHDLLTAHVWYEGQRAGLGDEFTEQVTAALERVAEMPGELRSSFVLLRKDSLGDVQAQPNSRRMNESTRRPTHPGRAIGERGGD